MKTDELREKYLAFFETKGHTRRPSDVLVPTWDPSVLFTPAGMNQFKDHFLGKVKLDFTRATTCQKCLRTGDIENVGRTAYHHTFFEMLGNFSFGDYFKREAITWAWEFLTEKKWLGIDPQRLSVTVYLDDDEAADIWHNEVGLPTSKIERMGEDDNFWPAGAPSQGPDGVCGPCSEIFYHTDRGSVEIWNLVFTQFNRVGDPPDNLRPLPSKNIDTGMGLERAAASLQGVETNYHIDILRPIVEAAAEVCGLKYDSKSDNGRRLRRITDHVRTCTFAVHENVYPGPKKERYVIKRLLRRAVLDGYQMGVHEPFLYQLVPVVVEMLKTPYPELTETASRVAKGIENEEKAFFSTIKAGLNRIEKVFAEMESHGRAVVGGEAVFELYDTYGFPPELFETLAAEHNFAIDWDKFRKLMEGRGGEAVGPVFKTGPIEAIKRTMHSTTFLGYETTSAEAEVCFIVAQDHLCEHLAEDGHDAPIRVILDRTPFYGEAGGQVGDTGDIIGERFRFEVTDTQRDGELIIHIGHLRSGEMRVGEKATARVETHRRQGIRRAHSATHLLHHALQQVLGGHAQQQGSKVDDDWLRFDFANMAPVNEEQLGEIERNVQEKVELCAGVKWETVPLAEARKQGAMMLFGEKYPDPVRMVSMGDFSRELCGGTHLDSTADVGPFEIVSEEAVSSGTRRIVALTGDKAKEHARRVEETLQEAAKLLEVPPQAVPEAVKSLAIRVRALKKQVSSGGGAAEVESKPTSSPSDEKSDHLQLKAALHEAARLLNVGPFDVPERIGSQLEEIRRLEEQLSQLKQSGAHSADSLLEKAEEIGGVKVIAVETPGANSNLMRQWIDQLRKKTSPIAVLLAAREGDSKVLLVAGISRDLVDRGLSAGKWVQAVAKVVDGGGGGKPDMAQAGGKDPAKLPQALETAKQEIEQALAKSP
ncbi:MAG: alanine--tRNA ligase [Planctomycetes bacterium]|nr:alanine--tRNA ligase [Planctomycetota bacterium]